MTDSTSRRFVGRKVVLGFLALIALTVGTTIFLFIRGMEPSGRILALRAEGERSALLLRATKGKRNHVQLVRVLDDGTQPHKITLYGIEEGAVPFVVGDRVLLEVTNPRGYPTVQAFDVRDLSFAYWAPEPSKTLADGARGATLVATVDRESVVVTVHAGSPGELLVFGVRDGKERLRKALDGVTAPATLVPLEGGGVRVGLEGGRALDLDLRDGSELDGGVPVEAEPACRVASGRLEHRGFDLGSVSSGERAELFEIERGCLVRDGRRFEVRTPSAARRFELTGARIGETSQAHVDARTLFVIVDETKVAIVDLDGPALRTAGQGLSIRELPAGDASIR